MLELNFNPFPLLETDRLMLREISLADANDLFLLRTNKEVMKYLDKPLPDSISEIEILIRRIKEDIVNNEAISWGISLKDQQRLIGTISYHKIYKEHFRAEIGYILNPEYWNKGLMSEAITRVIDFGFNQMKLHSIEANINPTNAKSAGILKKHNFQKEAFFKENYFFNGKFLDTEIYSLLKV